jgi:signal transduction histidine kinase
MDIENIILLVISLLNLSLGFFLFFKNKKSRINVSYTFFTFFIFLWGFSLFIFRLTNNIALALFAMRLSYISAALIATPFLYFAFIFPDNVKLSFIKKFFITLFTLFIIILLINKNFLIDKLIYQDYGKAVTLFTWHYFVYGVYFILVFFGACYILWRHYLDSVGILRIQLLYMIVGIFISGIFGTVFNLFLPSPWLLNFKWIWLGPSTTIIMVVFIAYAIIRYRLMDIRLVIKRSTIFTLLVLILTAIYSSLIIFFTRTFGDVFGVHSQLITSLIISILIVLGFQPLKLFIQKATSKFLFKAEYDPQEVLAELSESLSSSLELHHLFDDVDRILEKTFHPTKSSISLLNKESEYYTVAQADGFTLEEKNSLNFNLSDPLVYYFRTKKELLVLSELESRLAAGYFEEAAPLQKLKERLVKTGGEIFLPLFSKDNLIGIFVLGAKKSGDIYTSEDIRLIEIGGAQAAVAIENALMYEEVKSFNVTLQKEVDKATRELRAANARLKKLDEAKSDFISIASHQLRTPLTVIKGYISMMLEGSFGQLTEKEIESLHKVYESNQRLINLVEDLLNISRIESGRIQYNWEKSQLEDLVASVVDEISQNAKKKKLYLDFVKPEKVLPVVEMDKDKLRQVFMNLVDNAVKYTDKGGIRVSVMTESKNKNILVKVTDTGMGIDKSELPNLFQKFSRGKGMSRVHTEGTGLGLYVAKEMIKAHGGKIWAESLGKERGSTFYVSLPIVVKDKKS